MSTSEDAAMAEPGKKASHFQLVPHSKKNRKAKESIVMEGVVQHTIIYPTRMLMTADDSGTKSHITHVQSNTHDGEPQPGSLNYLTRQKNPPHNS